MSSWSAITQVQGLARAEALVEDLEALEPGAVGYFEIEDGSLVFEIGAHWEDAPDSIALSLLAAAHGVRDFLISEVPDEDWVAKVQRGLPPVEAGRFFVYGAHDAGRVPAGREPLLIEAAMAFGTGHHGTTKGCLLALERVSGERFANIADIGCGTAVLAMAARRLWPEAAVIASDIDEVAVDVARANLKANGMDGQVALAEAAGFDAPALAEAAPFDLILANILAGPLISLAPAMASHASPGATVILSGLLTNQAEEVADHYRAAGINLVSNEAIGDWSTLTLRVDAGV
ncbi:50S ribosomal protein L11 methyltransferase [Pseudoroseicyclus tamaricis]|uniref:Ribosomal protein L11 methyltransferase n=1 Tax=Pseudoroseicyclus tamaricis TaxID=2705421 RepID=A0A6B2JK69_9RHOB|nr:50S ribosomal protein L11 methyltransferase [Pseudoroseicyclus tamaricis]NDV01853.1 50S ribosomal protein L11 methyltransferase [Pseudoroseicyclus tamaricis]